MSEVLMWGIVAFVACNVAAEAANKDQFWQQSLSHYLVPPARWFWLQDAGYFTMAACELLYASTLAGWERYAMLAAGAALVLVVLSAIDFHYTQEKWVETLHIVCAGIAFLAPTAYVLGVGTDAQRVIPALAVASYTALMFNRHKDAGPLSEKLFCLLSVCGMLAVL